MIRPRDFIESKEGLFFAAIGEKEAYLRYFPTEKGDRMRGCTPYKKVASTAFSFDYLRENYPSFIGDAKGRLLQHCPRESIARVHRPEEKLAFLKAEDNELHAKCLRLNKVLREIPQDKKGVTGSILVDLMLPSSDIDFVIYGRDNFDRAREILRRSKVVKTLREDDWINYHAKRFPAGAELTLEDFIWHEERKHNIGRISGTLYNLLLVGNGVKDPEGEAIKKVKIRCHVIGAKRAFDVPAIYEVDHELVSHVLSFTHTYAGQAQAGEEIEVSGMLEKTGEHEYRVVVGTTREAEGEYIKVL